MILAGITLTASIAFSAGAPALPLAVATLVGVWSTLPPAALTEAVGRAVGAILSHPTVVDGIAYIIVKGISAWLAQPDLGTKVQGLVDAMATVDASTSAEAAARRAGETASTMVGSFFRGVCAGERQRDSPSPEHEVGRLKS